MANQAQVIAALYAKETVAATDTAPSYDQPADIPNYPTQYTASLFPGLTIWAQTVTLTAGALTLDLTALARAGASTVNLTGKRILAVKAVALSTNTSLVTIKPGASNPYSALGLGISLGMSAVATERPDEALLHIPSGTAVDATHKNLDFASVDTDASVAIIIIART
ncbi:hypothetical protein UFOVP1229_177 [uncultured Caudovirales phage]|uniref:Uncharacterized protein n=1 Tax=uncultured Caudovirales phage TaxID=2100421 RepID=A0A6J5R7S1_9CAUD|nr:hypothetical protein UFOVP1229_177 [uncultured Caudovirales phage]